MEQANNNKRTQPSETSFCFWIIILSKITFVWLAMLLPNASSAALPIEYWSLEPFEWTARIVPVTGSPATTTVNSTTPSSSSSSQPLTKPRKSKPRKNKTHAKKSKTKNIKHNRNKMLIVNLETEIPPTKTLVIVPQPREIGHEEKNIVKHKSIETKEATDWKVYILLIVITLLICNIAIQELNFRYRPCL